MIAEASSLMPSTRRPVPLRRRADLIVERIDYQQGNYYVVKDPVSLKYYRLGPEHYRVLELLDGTKSLEDVRTQLLLDFPYVRPSLSELQLVVIDLHTKSLVYSDRPGQGRVMLERRRETRKKRWASLAQNILSLRLPGWDPEWTLAKLYPLVRWCFHPVSVTLNVLLVTAAYLLLASQFDSFQQKLPEFKQFFGWPNLIYLYLTLASMKVLHELGHGLTCRHFGGECHEIGMIFLVFSPTLYCDVSDSWMMRNKWHRIAIGAAGMWVESVLSSLALFAWWFTHAGLLHHLCLNIFFISSVSTVLFNANPLMRYDGYYMLSDLLEIPNLAEKSKTLLRDAFSRTCLGIETREDAYMPQSGRGWLILYSLASTAYRWLVLFGITLFLYTVLKPYELQSIGVALAWSSLAGIVSSLVIGVVRILKTPRNKPLSRPRIAASLLVVAALAAAALAIPLPLHVYAPFLIEPQQVVHVYANVPGTIAEILVRPGAKVSQGALLLRLADPEKERQFQELQTQYRVAHVEVEKQRALDNSPRLEVAREQLQSIAAQLKDYASQLQQLQIVAPIDGRVVTAPRTPEPKQSADSFELHRWYGTPLDGRVGDYEGCRFVSAQGTGSFTPPPESSPFAGTAGEHSVVPEVRLEMVAPRGRVRGVLSAARSAHPYEEPLITAADVEIARSSARMGMLNRAPEGLTLAGLAARAVDAFGITPTVWGDPDMPVARVATATGSAGALVGDVLASGAAALVAGEVRYHDALDSVEMGLGVLEIGHDVSEWPLVTLLEDAVRAVLGLDSDKVHVLPATPGWWTP